MAITINGSGTIGGVSVGGLPDGIVDTDMLASAAVTSAKVGTLADSNMPAGSVLQVVQHWYDTRSTFSSGSTFLDTGLTLSITPTSSSNKILVIANISAGTGVAGRTLGFRLVRDGTAIGVPSSPSAGRLPATFTVAGPDSTNDLATGSFGYLDSPSTTSSITYKVQGGARDAAAWALNQPYTNNDSNTWFRVEATSSLIAMEIAA